MQVDVANQQQQVIPPLGTYHLLENMTIETRTSKYPTHQLGDLGLTMAEPVCNAYKLRWLELLMLSDK